jgi:prepilin-type N-terminal cleavage/methylation domain-containing protein
MATASPHCRLPGVCLTAARGFTLIELLVVIAIVAVLASIAVPVAGGVLDRGADAADVGNLRQIGTAISQFAADNNNRWPNAIMPIPSTTGDPAFMEHVDRYMDPDAQFSKTSRFNHRRRALWYSKRFAQMPSGRNYDPNARYYWGIAWAMNKYLWGSTAGTGFTGNLLKAPNLSKLVLVGEQNTEGGNFLDPDGAPSYERNVQTRYRVSRPGNKAYYLFGDYHIESISGDQSIASNPHYNSYNPTNRLYYRWWNPGQTP